jgi:hypothetical protein
LKKKTLLAIVVIIPLGWFCFRMADKVLSSEHLVFPVEILTDPVPFTLKKGDILARPNWSWMPGSYPLKGGRIFGHVAVVIEDASGKTIDEVLAKTAIIEAVFFDQATRKFIFRKDFQIREGRAGVAFGNRFKGLRYRLRTKLTTDETDALIRFLRNQLNGGYNIFTFKKKFASAAEKQNSLEYLKQGWHCATLTWEAFQIASGIDIDSNQGLLIYPSDIIACEIFDLPGGRIRF